MRKQTQSWRFFSNSVLAVIDQGFVSALGFLTTILLARYAADGELAIYALSLSALNFFRAIQLRGISTPYIVYWSKFSGDRLREFNSNSLCQILLLCILFAIGIGSVLLLVDHDTDYYGMLLVMIWAAPSIIFRDYVRQYFYAQDKVLNATVFDVGISLFFVVSAAYLITTNALNAASVYWSFGIPCFVGFAFFLLLNAKDHVYPPRIDNGLSKITWQYGRWLLAGRLIGTLGRQLIPWLLVYWAGKLAVDQLTVCASLTGLSYLFVIGWNNYLKPESVRTYASEGHEGLRRYWRVNASRLCVLLGALCAVYLVLADRVIPLLYDVQFEGMVIVACVLGIQILLSSLSMLCGNVLGALECSSPNFWAEMVACLGMLAGGLAFIPALGVTGAALAILLGTALSLAAMFFSMWWKLRSSENRPANDLVVASADGR